VGRKNSGKTTLIVELVERLTQRGRRVGTIKHTHHAHELDTPGKDSHRHRTAGAAAVGILAPNLSALYWVPSDDSDNDRYAPLLATFEQSGCEVVLVEGHATGEGEKIEVWRAATGTPPMALDDPTIVAVVSDDAPEVSVPVWRRSDIEAIVARLEDGI
jgi:molybdopterin-guanine dinucleotide biosynthesis protein MobB